MIAVWVLCGVYAFEILFVVFGALVPLIRHMKKRGGHGV